MLPSYLWEVEGKNRKRSRQLYLGMEHKHFLVSWNVRLDANILLCYRVRIALTPVLA